MSSWTAALRIDPRPLLTASKNPALSYLARRDLADGSSQSGEVLWQLPECRAILGHQREHGGWRYPGGQPAVRAQVNYDQLETYRQLGFLVEKFELSKKHPAIQRAAKFLFSFQTEAGDFRGIYGNQYSPNYSAAITGLLIKTGYGASREVTRALRWLLSMRQEDGGWALPLRTRGKNLDIVSMHARPLEPDRRKPSAHLITGIVLRALAAHPRYRPTTAVRKAGELLKSRFFMRDRYPDHVGPGHWLTFSYPFWWTDLLSSLDSLTRIGFTRRDPDIARGLNWLIEHQQGSGLWQTGRNRPKDPYSDQWVALAICRVLKRSLQGTLPKIDPIAWN